MNALDLKIFRWLNSWAGANDFFDWNIIFRAEYLLYIIIAAVFLFYVFDKDKARAKTAILHAFLAGLLARFVFAEIIRFFYSRPRPFEVLEGVRQLIFHPSGASFPSGHASFSFAVASAIFYYYPKASILFFAASFAMGAGRISVGIHWPSDILGGAFLGLFIGWLVRVALKKLKKA